MQHLKRPWIMLLHLRPIKRKPLIILLPLFHAPQKRHAQLRKILHRIRTSIRLTLRPLRPMHRHALIQPLLHRLLVTLPHVPVPIPPLCMKTMPRMTQFVQYQSPRSPQVAIRSIMAGVVKFHSAAFVGIHPVPHQPGSTGMEAGVSSAEGGGFGSEGLGFVDPDGRGFLELGAGARREGSGGGEDVGFESLAEFVGGGGGGVFGWGRRFVGSGVGFSIVVVVVVVDVVVDVDVATAAKAAILSGSHGVGCELYIT
mmetsp:Transcript_22148/g.45875  ORF Transcript_22148/g.45875 Transcript_22148/m.45875 type:complete len:256 (-) Transcript_22148:32-799(-)